MTRLRSVLMNNTRGLHGAAFVLAFATVLSQLLALLRDRLLAQSFGVDVSLDIYYAAFRIPDFVYLSVASLFSAAVIIPFLIERREKSDEAAHSLFGSLLVGFGVAIVPAIVGVWFLVPALTPYVAPGFNGSETDLFVRLTRLLLFSPLLLGLSGVVSGAVQAWRYFALYSLAPVVYNIGIIAGIVLLAPTYGVVGVGYGVLLGALLHILIQLPVLFRHQMLRGARVRVGEALSVMRVSLPRTLTLSLTQLQMVALTAFASLLAAGSIAAFQFAFNLQSIPLSLVGVSYSIAAFPLLSTLWVQNKKIDFSHAIERTEGHVIVWSALLAVLFAVLRSDIVTVVLGVRGVGASEISLIANTMAIFVASLVPQGLILLYTRSFYAIGKTFAPLVINVCAVLVTLALAYTLPDMAAERGVHELYGLAVAFSIGAWVNALMLRIVLNKNVKVAQGVGMLVHTVAAIVLLSFVVYVMYPFYGRLLGGGSTLKTFLIAFGAGIDALAIAVLYLYVANVSPAVELIGKLIEKTKPRAH